MLQNYIRTIKGLFSDTFYMRVLSKNKFNTIHEEPELSCKIDLLARRVLPS